MNQAGSGIGEQNVAGRVDGDAEGLGEAGGNDGLASIRSDLPDYTASSFGDVNISVRIDSNAARRRDIGRNGGYLASRRHPTDGVIAAVGDIKGPVDVQSQRRRILETRLRAAAVGKSRNSRHAGDRGDLEKRWDFP